MTARSSMLTACSALSASLTASRVSVAVACKLEETEVRKVKGVVHILAVAPASRCPAAVHIRTRSMFVLQMVVTSGWSVKSLLHTV